MIENWNFHGYVAIPLEVYSRKYIGETTYDSANAIENGEFVNAMFKILSVEFNGLDEIKEFVDKCRDYEGKLASQIPIETAIDLFDEFKQILQTIN